MSTNWHVRSNGINYVVADQDANTIAEFRDEAVAKEVASLHNLIAQSTFCNSVAHSGAACVVFVVVAFDGSHDPGRIERVFNSYSAAKFYVSLLGDSEKWKNTSFEIEEHQVWVETPHGGFCQLGDNPCAVPSPS